ncbi:MAG: metallophosphatase domain-containing protein [Bacteroidia bacterium]|jgi:Icc-related predicted phosphoesterase|nr:metallophosphatase domain-containing protein [Bacteroidia bacterium]
MKFLAISDTHGQHDKLQLPPADAIIHAGDISSRGRESEVADFLRWFSKLDYKYRIFIAGNHDFFFEKNPAEKVKQFIPDNVIYLNDSGITIEGIHIWGSPISPWFYDWAFNRHRGSDIDKHWQLIPADTDILVTHGPVYGLLDKVTRGEEVGCKDLLRKVQEIKPAVHLCGHIHEAYGQINAGDTLFINASVLDEDYRMKNAPVIFEL